MNTKIGLGQVEDKPALTYVIMHKTQLITNERPYFLGIRCVEQPVDSLNHLTLLRRVKIVIVSV